VIEDTGDGEMSDAQLVDTWQDLSTFYKSLLKGVTYSDLDRPEGGTVCYAVKSLLDQQERLEEDQETICHTDVAPLVLQSLFYIRTRTGRPFRLFIHLFFHLHFSLYSRGAIIADHKQLN
jgi:hypothetical protein